MMSHGDLVQLKSGGPTMTVRGEDKDKLIACVWYNWNENRYDFGSFSKAVLTKEIKNRA